MNEKELAGGVIGTSLSAIGTALQVNEVLQTISLIITILGGIISLVVVPLLNWYKHAKKDGKITKDEIENAVDIFIDGVDEIKRKGEENDNGEVH